MRAVADSALLVVPSRHESFSYAAAEALLLGREVVVSDRVGLVEHVPGLDVFPAEDDVSLAVAQMRILDDIPAALQRARRHRTRLLESCGPEAHLAARAAFARHLTGTCAGHVAPAVDTAERGMDAFLAGVEAAEHAVIADGASSAA